MDRWKSWIDVSDVLPWLPKEPYFLESDLLPDVMGKLRNVGFTVAEADLSGVRTEKEFLSEIGRELKIPGGPAPNWDALRDLLQQLGRAQPFGIALVLPQSDAFLGVNVHSFVRCVSVLRFMSQELSDVENLSTPPAT
ncbi:barstar family protein [Streptomyces sp. MAR4 CNX-425]|uniref:barstar family protein n=1 Tax=Streptomyces sp. MAR4 CNX-425 TaxID=3406343 RepID=UPI003B5079CF